MPRSTLKPPTNSVLPRRSVLKALAIAPAAVAAETGEALSAPGLCSTWKDDERYVKAERLIEEVNQSYNAVLASREGELNDEGEDACDLAGDRWQGAKSDLSEYATELSEKPKKDMVDALVLAKIADFQVVDEDDDIAYVKDSVSGALRSVLEANGVLPTEHTASSVETKRFNAEIASRPRKPERAPMSANAGNLISRVRQIGDAYEAAMRREASIADDTPESERAIAITNRRLAELEALRDEIIFGRSTGLSRWRTGECDPYAMTGMDEFAVFCELITAFQPGFWIDVRRDGLDAVFAAMRTSYQWQSEHCLREAEAWNEKKESADV